MGKTYSFARELGGVLMEEARTVMDILIPRTCIVCGETLTTHEKHLCINCQADLPLTFFWERKKNPMADKVNAFVQKRIEAEVNAGEDVTPDKASTAQALPHIHYSYAAALFFYHGENRYKKIPQRLKYLADIDEGTFYARMLGEFMNDSEHFSDIGRDSGKGATTRLRSSPMPLLKNWESASGQTSSSAGKARRPRPS